MEMKWMMPTFGLGYSASRPLALCLCPAINLAAINVPSTAASSPATTHTIRLGFRDDLCLRDSRQFRRKLLSASKIVGHINASTHTLAPFPATCAPL